MEVNDMKAMREACTNIAEYARSAQCHTTDAHILGYLDQIEVWAKAALVAPARNCDVISNRDDAVRLFQAAFVEAVARHLHLTNAAYVKIIEPLGELLEIAIEVLYSTYHAEDSAAQNNESEVSHGNA